MKKTFAFLSSLLILSTACTSVSAEGYSVGDADLDGSVTAHDAAMISRYINAGDISLTTDQLERADYDGNGIIDESDAEAISAVSEFLLGDIDCDGSRTLLDCVKIYYMCAPFNTEPADAEEIARGDVDADGIITINDFALSMQNNSLSSASVAVDFGCSYFHWNAENMLMPTKTPLRSVYTVEDLKPMNYFGDVNQDNCLNELDAEYITNFIEKGEISDEIRIADADINIDGVIDQKDIDEILENATYLLSDVNEDCYVCIDDAAEVLSYYARKGACFNDTVTMLFQQTDESEYDINRDGEVDVSDAASILKEYAIEGADL